MNVSLLCHKSYIAKIRIYETDYTFERYKTQRYYDHITIYGTSKSEIQKINVNKYKTYYKCY